MSGLRSRLAPIGSFLDAWERTSEAGRGAMLRRYVEGGEVDGENVTVHFREEAGLSPLVVQKVSYRGAYGRGRPKQAASEL